MKTTTRATLLTATLLASAGIAHAEGELQIYNWGNYTSPELIEKFEKQYDIDVTVTDYDSNTTALTKIEAGGHGFDIVVPSANYVPIFVEKGLLMEARPDEMENFKNVAPEWVDVAWDPGRHYTVPWQWGTTGVSVNTSAYSGDVNTSAIFMDPPEELIGKVNVVPEMNDVMSMAIMYAGGKACTEDKELLKKVRDLLVAAKPKWMSMDYGMTDKMAANDVMASVNWSGSSFRIRKNNPDVVYGYPKEGYPIWMDSVAILTDAKNVENAKLFMNFIMEPENAAMISAFAGYANGITGSEEFMPEDMKTAPEVNVPEEFKAAGTFLPTCPSTAQKFYTAIWTELQK
ncbi:extracellular solute-binding protein [Paroceanicella profunda]|uniref:Putrescine-binding periplasmic protein n=1 Tax=Paroceanicella profunda TaxID=2579971 RepID=A0A5B8FVE4_9RHOB|nr:extracellular solute-binding protein [Paroceanicella profunda]QDL90449.1 extracellular solute-binding protein [Paroceanicella profunda]